jgi:DNA-binding NtrC family response regulator
VRELRNVLERACISSEGRILIERDILSSLGGGQAAAASAALHAAAHDVGGPGPSLAEVTRDRIEQALQQVGGNRSAAARLLGISRRALYRRLDSFNLR